MNLRRYLPLLSYLLTGIFLILFLNAQFFNKEQRQLNSDDVNLALRQTTHKLYAYENDMQRQIPPIKELDGNQYSVKITRSINYDSLPQTLDAALNAFNIDAPYTVILRDCTSEKVLLGYNMASFENKEVACKEREQSYECQILAVRFEEEKVEAALSYYLFPLLLSFFAALFLTFKTKAKNSTTDQVIVIESELAIPLGLRLSHSVFNPQNQEITIRTTKKELTFRETKILELFFNNENQVLKREDIQKHVWGDEGVIVGRSMDVFISRLRKILKEDEALVLKSVHGVGYRLEVKTAS